MLYNNSSLITSIVHNLFAGSLKSLLDNLDSMLLVEVFHLDIIECFGAVQKSHSSSDDDSLFKGTSSGHNGVIESVLDLLDLDLGGPSDLDDSDSSTELGLSLLELLLVILRSGQVHLLSDLIDSSLDNLSVSGAINDDSLVLIDDDFLGSAEDAHVDVFEGHSKVGVEDLRLGQNSNVIELVLSIVAEAWSLDADDSEDSLEFVENESGEWL